MKKRIYWSCGIVGAVLLLVLGSGLRKDRDLAIETAVVERGPLQAWMMYEGDLESRNVRYIFSKMTGPGTIVELIAEGTPVREGDWLVRMDSSSFDRDLLRLEKEKALAEAELTSLKQAKIPQELSDLEMKILQIQSDLESEEKYLQDSRQLVKEGLVAEAEVQLQEKKVASLKAQEKGFTEQLRLMREYLHPSALAKAEANMRSAERELELVRQQIKNCTILAPADGVVVYKSSWVANENRAVRVGDTVYKNQPFLMLPDMSNLIVNIDVPESELSQIEVGQQVQICPRAYPQLRLRGVVESVGSMAQTRNQSSSRHKFFHLVVALEEHHELLRTGMSVSCKVLSADLADAVLVQRSYVAWENDEAFCYVLKDGDKEKRKIVLGKADDKKFSVEQGLTAGERLVLP